VPVSYTRDDRTRQITVLATGALTLADLLAVLTRQAAEGTWSYGMLYDAQNAAFVPTADNVEALADRARALSRGCGQRGLVAIVTPQPQAFAMATSYSSLTSADVQVRVFLNRSSAQRWLTDTRTQSALSCRSARKG